MIRDAECRARALAATPDRRDFCAQVAGWAAFGAALMTAGCNSKDPDPAIQVLSFDELPGWRDDDHAAALRVFSETLEKARAAPVGPVLEQDWRDLAARASRTRYTNARSYFEALFTPVRIGRGAALLTAYYEPEIRASRRQGGPYQVPIHAPPANLEPAQPHLTRASIANGALDGEGLELFWLADPIDGFFLEIQGSGRLILPDGSSARVGFAAKNGHPYYAIGRALIERGAMTLEQVSVQSIKAWLRAHPEEAQAVMNRNASYVFFRERMDLKPDAGPVGAMGVSVTAGRSLAVDPAFHPLGAPIWLVPEGGSPGEDAGPPKLMVAQDIGGAIKGAQRADIFLGSGAEAGDLAGQYRKTGKLVTLIPNAAAARLAVV